SDARRARARSHRRRPARAVRRGPAIPDVWTDASSGAAAEVAGTRTRAAGGVAGARALVGPVSRPRTLRQRALARLRRGAGAPRGVSMSDTIDELLEKSAPLRAEHAELRDAKGRLNRERAARQSRTKACTAAFEALHGRALLGEDVTHEQIDGA